MTGEGSPQGHKQDQSDLKKIHMIRFGESNKESALPTINVRLILSELPLQEKLRVILHYHMTLANKWKEQYEIERNENVPLVLCIICGRRFFADMGQKHNESCVEKNLKSEAQK